MKVKVAEAEGIVLDWMAAKAQGLTPTLHKNSYGYWVLPNIAGSYSTDPSLCQPILEDRKISLCWEGKCWVATRWYEEGCCWVGHAYGPTQLIAGLRCVVAAELGFEVDVPDELVKKN